MSVDPNIEKFIRDNYRLMKAGNYDEVYELALRQSKFKVSALTQTLWDCDVHPELEGLTEIPRGFAAGLDLKTFQVPWGITSIRHDAFARCASLTSVTIPTSVTSIGNYAFAHCTSLSSITIPAGVTHIGYGAFLDCPSLTSMTISDGVTSIKNNVFLACTSLSSITISDGVKSIGDGAFAHCTSLKEIIFEGTKGQWKAVQKGRDWKRYVRNLIIKCKDGEVKYK